MDKLATLLFENKDKIPEGNYLEMMNALKEIKDKREGKECKRCLIVLPLMQNFHICPIHQHFDLSIDFCWVNVTRDYPYYDDLNMNSPFIITEYQPLMLFYSLGLLKFRFPLSSDFVCNDIIGRVIAIEHETPQSETNQSIE